MDILPVKKNRPENWKSSSVTLCGIQCRFQNCLCFSSIIDSFDFSSFEVPKIKLHRKTIFIIIISFLLLLSFCVTIWMRLIRESCVLVWYFSLHASFYTLFNYELGFSIVHLVIMTSPRYYDITHLCSDCNETCTLYVKSKIKMIYSRRFFHFLLCFQIIYEFCDVIMLRWRPKFFHRY